MSFILITSSLLHRHRKRHRRVVGSIEPYNTGVFVKVYSLGLFTALFALISVVRKGNNVKENPHFW